MNGLELSKGYYETYGKPMLENGFPELLPFIAAGFTGSGLEHYGFDDELSRDHDFEPGFCIFLPDESVVDRRQAFLLERAYAKLPEEFEGVKRQRISPAGGNRNGVIRTKEYFLSKVGSEDGTLSSDAWLYLPDQALSEAVNGEIFFDGYGEVTRIRKTLSEMPEDIKLKRLAGNCLFASQTGQYNFARSVSRGEYEAAALALTDFSRAVMKCVFLLRGSYMPYYKWSFRALRRLPGTEMLSEDLSFLLTADNRSSENLKKKEALIEDTAALLIKELKKAGIETETEGNGLERIASALNDRIRDNEIRNRHILTAVPDT